MDIENIYFYNNPETSPGTAFIFSPLLLSYKY